MPAWPGLQRRGYDVAMGMQVTLSCVLIFENVPFELSKHAVTRPDWA
jgi:alkylation response protein AidB-like acyl-CoA dehydrogenase